MTDDLAQRLDKAERVQAGLLMAYEAMSDSALTAAAPPRGDTSNILQRMNAVSGRAQPSPSAHSTTERVSESSRTRPVVTAATSSGAAGIVAGSQLVSGDQLTELITESLRTMRHGDPSRSGRQLVASVRWEYPEERRLGVDPFDNGRKFEAVCGLRAGRYDRQSGALVATGGICLPTNVDYAVPTWSTTDRPLRDGLPAFQADRGGVQFVTPPDIGVPTLQGGTASGAGTATGVWTEATDANPAGATKPVWQVSCGNVQQVYVNAIPTRVGFGNMQARFAPEQIEANTQQAMAIAAREAELELLTLIAAKAKPVLAQQYLGAVRDILGTVDALKSQYVSSHRFSRNVALTAIFPDWARDLMRADIAREAAHDNAGSINALAISDDQIDDWFTVRGVNVIWTLDGLQAGTYNGQSQLAQYFPVMTSGAYPGWPNGTNGGTAASIELLWFLFVEGTFQFLDGGSLDIGVVRDSILDATNDYEMFTESFEGLADRGIEAYAVQSTVIPNGASASTVAASGYHE